MKRLIIVSALAVAVLFALAIPASAHGVSPAKLARAGWACEDVPGLGVHCFPPGTTFGSPSVSALVFGGTTDPADSHASLTSTEILLRSDLYAGQPCPGEDSDHWHALPFGYHACHHPVR